MLSNAEQCWLVRLVVQGTCSPRSAMQSTSARGSLSKRKRLTSDLGRRSETHESWTELNGLLETSSNSSFLLRSEICFCRERSLSFVHVIIRLTLGPPFSKVTQLRVMFTGTGTGSCKPFDKTSSESIFFSAYMDKNLGSFTFKEYYDLLTFWFARLWCLHQQVLGVSSQLENSANTRAAAIKEREAVESYFHFTLNSSAKWTWFRLHGSKLNLRRRTLRKLAEAFTWFIWAYIQLTKIFAWRQQIVKGQKLVWTHNRPSWTCVCGEILTTKWNKDIILPEA